MRLQAYWKNCQLDLRLFLFLLVMMAVYRLLFMAKYAGAMSADAGWADILLANFTGLRLSLKSAGGFALLSFVLVTLPGLVFTRFNGARLRWGIGALGSFILTVLFLARFPYYEEFRMTYGLQVFQGWHDDRAAVLGMMIHEYHLLPGLLVALLLAAIWSWGLKKLLALPLITVSGGQRPKTAALVSLLVTAAFILVCRFGGGVSYATGVNWENAAVTGDDFLNECILDDVQAMYRAINQEKRMRAGDIFGVDKERAGTLTAAQLDQDLTRKAAGASIAKPRHIFIVLGETWAQWPLLDKYADLHCADGLKSLVAADNSYYTSHFMPNGDFTSVAITGMITGLPEVNVRVNYQPRSFKEIYPTALAQPFHELGYKVDFWYGGTPNWDNIGRLALAQGFDAFYGYPDYKAEKTNTWGTNDRNLFQALANHLTEEEPTVHLIMTTSNHPPYNVDLAAEGFDVDAVEAKVRELIPDESDPHNLAVELGHYYYMDKVVTEFVRQTEAEYPDSLFVITGDHAVRSNPGAHPTMFEFQSVPLVIHGAGVRKDMLPAEAVGGHIGIMPTLVEMIAPQGFVYKSLVPPLGQWPAAFNRDFYVTDKAMGQVGTDKIEGLAETETVDSAAEQDKLLPFLQQVRTWGWWLIMHADKEEK
ncbi:Phosphoglycerol transferase MdoB [Selenomonas ruminantium]|uniref:Phosphoglycerol transferase MdoB n=1 Tax=Selenomonas ruminantium TaxID=971 RepID=A0A1M6TFC9_SELRU|nr:LTA synthase family protein [Selenomonas ruminantium]SHK55742.1 Phosphoglycerol transferase MdoB [Selenomonas ruminantium]